MSQEFNLDGRAGDVMIDSYSNSARWELRRGNGRERCVKILHFNEDFGNVFKSAIGALVYKLR